MLGSLVGCLLVCWTRWSRFVSALCFCAELDILVAMCCPFFELVRSGVVGLSAALAPARQERKGKPGRKKGEAGFAFLSPTTTMAPPTRAAENDDE